MFSRRSARWLILLHLFVLLFTACRTTPTDIRALAPAETIIYLETEDLGAMLESVVQNKAFWEATSKTPDFSAFSGTQAAVIVTGFEASEKSLAGEAAILNFKPQFVLIADTHSWERTNLALIENQFGDFVKRNYGETAKLKKSEKNGIRFFVWTAEANRRIYAAVSGSLIYIANNEVAIDKCLAVKRGENENLLKNESLAQARGKEGEPKLAFGYISAEGIAQLADYAGVAVASEASEESVIKSFIAKTLPQLARQTVREVSWTVRKSEQGIEDKIYIKPDAPSLDVWKSTLLPASADDISGLEYLPTASETVTRYNLQNPQIGWRSLLLTLAGKLDGTDGKIWIAVSGSFFAPYGIADSETFLNAAGSPIFTARVNSESDDSVAIVSVKDESKIKSALGREFNFNRPPEQVGAARLWKSAESDLAAAFIERRLILGTARDVAACLQAGVSSQNLAKSNQAQFFKSNAVTLTQTRETETANRIASVLTNNASAKNAVTLSTTETRFNANGIERRTISDFGLIGTLIEQFAKER